jgi:hypothetical protein
MAFQRNAFQPDALQPGSTPKPSNTAFQPDAFQSNAFQVGKGPTQTITDRTTVEPFVTSRRRSRRFQTAPDAPVYPQALSVPFTAYAPIKTNRRTGWRKGQLPLEVDSHPLTPPYIAWAPVKTHHRHGWRKDQRLPEHESFPQTPIADGPRALNRAFVTNTLRSRRFQTAPPAPVFPATVTVSAATLPAYAPIKTNRRHGWRDEQRAVELDRFAQIPATSPATLPAYAPIKTNRRYGWRKEQRALELDSRTAATPVTATDRAVRDLFVTRHLRSRRFQTSPPCPTAPLPRVDAVFAAWRQPDVHRRYDPRPEVQIVDVIISGVVQPYMAWNTRLTHRRADRTRRESQNPTPLDFIAKQTPNFPAWLVRPVKRLSDRNRTALRTVPIEHIGRQATNYPSWATRPVILNADRRRRALMAPDPIVTAIPTSAADIAAWAIRPVKHRDDPRRQALGVGTPILVGPVQPYMAWKTRPVLRRAPLVRHRQEVLTEPYFARTPAEFSFAAVMTPRILRRHGWTTEQRALIPPVYPLPAAPVLPSTDIRDVVIRPFLIEHHRKML